MTKPFVQIGEEVREMTDEEFTQYQLDAAKIQEEVTAMEEKSNAKTALLERLGITEDEAKLLLN
jgi:translation elongation factor P/translation initiation factor 5A